MEGGPSVQAAVTTNAEAILDRVIRVTSVSELSALTGVQNYQALVLGVPFVYDSGAWVPSAGYVTLDAYGAKRDGTDNSAVFANIETALSDFEGTIVGLAGTYYTDGPFNIPLKSSFKGAGKNATFISAHNSSGIFPDFTVVSKSGPVPTAMADLSVNTAQGDTTATFASAHGLSQGDVFLIYNPADFSFSNWRNVYRDGEFCTVAEVVSTTVVGLDKPIYAAHSISAVEIYRCNELATGDLTGFTAIAPGDSSGRNSVRALTSDWHTLSKIENVGARGSDNTSHALFHSYRLFGIDLDAFQWGTNPGSATQYGLAVGNSQELDLSGRFVGHRHGITCGGGATFSIPCRDIHVHDFSAKGDDGAIASADWHGNAEYCSYRNGVINGGGLNVSGNNNVISGITGGGIDMMVILGRELLGCDHIVEDVSVWTGRNDLNRGLLDIGGNSTPFTSDTLYGGTFNFSRIKVKAPDTVRHCIGIRNRGYTGAPWRVVARDVEYIAASSDSVSFPVVLVYTVSGDSPESVDVTNATSPESEITPALRLAGPNDGDALVKGIRLAGTQDISLLDTNTNGSAAVTFRNFPKLPTVVTSSVNFATGTDRIAAYAASLSDGGFTLTIHRVDQVANFSADLAAKAAWVAELNEF